MSESSEGSDGIPSPRDDDDGDVAWALTTAQVQWGRGSAADAVVWLRRAVGAAIEAGHSERAGELERRAAQLTEAMLDDVSRRSSPNASADFAPGADDVDALLGAQPGVGGVSTAPPPPSRTSIDVELESPAAPPAFDGDTTMMTDYAHDDVAAARAALDAAESARQNVSVVPTPGGLPKAPPPPPRGLVAPGSVDIATNPFLQQPDESIPSAEAQPVASADFIDSGAVHSADVASVRSEQAPSTDVDSAMPVRSEDVLSMPATTDRTSDLEESLDTSPSEDELTIPAITEAEIAAKTRGEATPDAAAPNPSRGGAVVEGVALDDVAGLQDLPEEAHAMLASSAKTETINLDEEIGHFEVALVVEGWVQVMPAIDDVSAVVVQVGEVVFTTGTLDQGVELRVVAGEDGTRVAVWDRETYEKAVADCPWVADDLRLVADRYQALAGATMGPLGERLDDQLRGVVFDKLEVRALGAGEVLVEKGQPSRGMTIVGAGHVEIVDGDDVVGDLGLGEFVFPERVLDHGPASSTARAGDTGALVLVGRGMATQELLTSVPPLLEILAGG